MLPSVAPWIGPAIRAIALASAVVTVPAVAQETTAKPNIVVIWGDDIGWYNPAPTISA
jgi:hypothetical protein